MKKKDKKTRNYVVIKMIERNQGAGLHQDKKKEFKRKACRKKINYKDYI
tara:strand:+ start:497 stop:643 length:147 start_codon:yes stop_codon:yes gene_type:complete